MFDPKEKPRHQRQIEEELERTLAWLRGYSPSEHEEYAKMLTIVERLHDLVPKEEASGVRKETLINVGANLLGIFMILKHEQVNVITSKALGFVSRIR